MPSFCGTARVRTAERSEPACGSVRTIVPVHSPETSFGRYARLSASEPSSSRASMAPRVSMGQSAKETLAPFHISSTSAETRRGTPWPPNSGGQDRAFQPPSTNWR